MLTVIAKNAHQNAKNANPLNIATNVLVTEFLHLIVNVQLEQKKSVNQFAHLVHLNVKHAMLMDVLNAKVLDIHLQLANAQMVLSKMNIKNVKNVVINARNANSKLNIVLNAQLTESNHQNVSVQMEPSMMVKMKNVNHVHMNA